MLTVPAHIVKPPYAETGKVTRWQESAVKSPEIIERMRIACSAAAEVLRLAGEFVVQELRQTKLMSTCTTCALSVARIRAH